MSVSVSDLAERLKALLSFSVLVYLCGFIARRTGLQMLGVQVEVPLADQLYLETGVKYLVETAHALLPLAAVALLVIYVASKLGAQAYFGRLWVTPGRSAAVCTVLVTSLGLVSERAYARLFSVETTQFLWTDLGRNGPSASAWYLLLTALAALVAASVVLVFYQRARLGAFASWLAAYGSVALTFSRLSLPMAYGRLNQRLEYPLVRLLQSGAVVADIDYFLLLETKDWLVLAEPGGTTLTLRRDAARVVQVRGFRNLFANWRRRS